MAGWRLCWTRVRELGGVKKCWDSQPLFAFDGARVRGGCTIVGMRLPLALVCLMCSLTAWGQQRGRPALEDLIRSAEQGDADVQFSLGVGYVKGRGVPQDYGAARKWFQLAAEQGHAAAQFNLGLMYASGLGVPRDYGEAVRWYRKAAKQGNAAAQHNLGMEYALGESVPRNYVEAYMWLNLAVSRESGAKAKSYVKDRDAVAGEMTPQQIAKAQRLAREWKPETREKLQEARP